MCFDFLCGVRSLEAWGFVVGPSFFCIQALPSPPLVSISVSNAMPCQPARHRSVVYEYQSHNLKGQALEMAAM